MSEGPGEIWLQPWCDGCERHCHDEYGRTWCQDNVYDDCEECGRKAVRYVVAPLESGVPHEGT